MSTSISARRKEEIPPRKRILAAAWELFYSRGIRSVSVDDIAAAAQTSKVTLYRHFGSKDVLIAEYLRSRAERCSVTNDALRAHSPDAYARLRSSISRAGGDLRNADCRGDPVSNAAVELPEKDHPARAVIEDLKTQQRERAVELCREAGFLEPQRVADEILLLYEGACVNVQSVGRFGPGARFAEIALALIDSHPRQCDTS